MATAFEFTRRFTQNINAKFDPEIRTHLAKVYSCLTATVALSLVGACTHLFGVWEAGFLSILGSLGLVIALQVMRDDNKNFNMRFGMLMGLGFFSGHGLGPLLDHVIAVNPQIIVTALVGTTVVFVSFSLAALLATRGKYLFLGGICMSILNTMALFGLANLFFRSTMVYQLQLYVGLVVMSTFILYDTQAIIEKYRIGNRDCVGHSLDLFVDFISVFRRLLIILTQKEQRDQRKRRND